MVRSTYLCQARPLSLPWRDADWQWKTRGARPMTFSWVTWQLRLWPAKNAHANKFCIASLKEVRTLKRADRACEETWRAYITLYRLLLRASHILLASCKDAVVWQGSLLKSYTAVLLALFLRLSLCKSRWECLTAAGVCTIAQTPAQIYCTDGTTGVFVFAFHL